MVENAVFKIVEIGENFLKVYIIRKESETAENADLEPFVSIFKNIDLWRDLVYNSSDNILGDNKISK